MKHLRLSILFLLALLGVTGCTDTQLFPGDIERAMSMCPQDSLDTSYLYVDGFEGNYLVYCSDGSGRKFR